MTQGTQAPPPPPIPEGASKASSPPGTIQQAAPVPPAGTPPFPGGMPMPPPPKKKGMSRGLKVGLVIALCLIALIVVGIVVGVFAFVKVVSAPADAANSYVKALNEGNLSQAYSDLSAKTQKTETRAGFEKKFSVLKDSISKYNTSSINVGTSGGQTTAKVVMQLSLTGGSKATWDMALVKENGKWKIQAIRPR
jgi:Tfp pilus assembly protein PilE